MDAVEDVAARFSLPAVPTGEETVVGWVVAGSADVVQRRRPPHVVAFLVGPGGHGREVARWAVADHRVIIGREDGTDGVEDIWFEMRLGDGRDYLMAFTGLRYYDVAKSTEVNVPAAPHARAPGRLLKPAMAATLRKRKERMLMVWDRTTDVLI